MNPDNVFSNWMASLVT